MPDTDTEEVAYPDAYTKCILLDIEGTICPISFVKDTLFPYALKALPEVLNTKWDDEEFQKFRDKFPDEHRGSPEAFLAHVQDLTERDVKVAYLKGLQGFLWEHGYQSGEYSTPLFPDVLPMLKHWLDEGRELAVYSSGSVFAQKLLFAHVKSSSTGTGAKRKHEAVEGSGKEAEAGEPPAKKRAVTADDGVEAAEDQRDIPDETALQDEEAVATDENATHDLQYLISNWFDTTNAGPKTEESSYATIAAIMEILPQDFLFLSDNVNEVGSAIDAGMDAILVDRPGNAPVSEHHKLKYGAVDSFDEISLAELPRSKSLLVSDSDESEAGAEDADDGDPESELGADDIDDDDTVSEPGVEDEDDGDQEAD